MKMQIWKTSRKNKIEAESMELNSHNRVEKLEASWVLLSLQTFVEKCVVAN